ncbi:uncharacterized protein LOC135830859 [Sycon ciliatum]|uniref:uncharacterized protein LOC135830859 n=1 Tax=Sycon ciliatum TaxID=27933 RepID=UPI0031F6590E
MAWVEKHEIARAVALLTCLLSGVLEKVHAGSSCFCTDTASTKLQGAKLLEQDRSSGNASSVTDLCTTDEHYACETRCALAGYPLHAFDHRGHCFCAWNLVRAEKNASEGNVIASLAVCRPCSQATRPRHTSCHCGASVDSLWVCLASYASLSVVSPAVAYLGCYTYDKRHIGNQTIPTALLGSEVETFTYYDAPTPLQSTAVCAGYCRAQNPKYTYAAIGNYWHCVCGTAINELFRRKLDSKCVPCDGDRQLKCGRSNSMAVYMILTARITAELNGVALPEHSTLRPGQMVTMSCRVAETLHSQGIAMAFSWNCSDGDSMNTTTNTSGSLNVTLDDEWQQLICTCFVDISQPYSGPSSFAITQFSLYVEEANTTQLSSTVGDVVTAFCDVTPCLGGSPVWQPEMLQYQLQSSAMAGILLESSGLTNMTFVASKSMNNTAFQCICDVDDIVLGKFSLSVKEFPGSLYIDTPELPHIVPSGSTVALLCKANSSLASGLTIAWHWYSPANSDSPSAKQVKHAVHDPMLRLINVSERDTGLYTCRAKSNGVVVLRTHVPLQVEGKVTTRGHSTSDAALPTFPVETQRDGEKESYFEGNNLVYMLVIAGLVFVMCSIVMLVITTRLRRARAARLRRAEEETDDDDSVSVDEVGIHHNNETTNEAERQLQDNAPTSEQSPSAHFGSLSQRNMENASNAPNQARRSVGTGQYDSISKDSSFCISPMPSSIQFQIGRLEDRSSLPHTYSSVPVDSDSGSKNRVIGRSSRLTSQSSSTTSSINHEYDHLRYTNLEEMLVQPYQPPPDSETAIYSHLKQRGYRRIEASDIELGGEIGSGHFGVIRSGWWIESQSGRRVPVAVKTMQDNLCMEKRVEFLREAAIMCQFRHRYIVYMYGVVTSTLAKDTMLVLELLDPRNLREYLQGLASKSVTRDLGQQFLRFSGEIAEGMAYLAAKSFVHRDLAARNILRGMDGTCKISDFGLSCNISDVRCYTGNGRLLPIRWSAPETLSANKFSTASDVWSYGILLYEIWSAGKRPYHLWSNEKVVEEVQSGYRLPKPVYCPDDVYEVMTDSWNKNRHHRPTFRAISHQLGITDMTKVAWATEAVAATAAQDQSLQYCLPFELALPAV